MLGRFKSDFNRDVFTLVTGTSIAQIIPLLISPLLTRLYSPTDFGVFAVYFSALMIISVLATGKYEMAIVLPEKDQDALKLFFLSVLISVVVSFIILVVICLLVFLFSLPESILKSKYVLLLLPIGLLLIGVSQSLHYLLNRSSKYKNLARGRIARSIAYSVVAIVIGLLKPSGLALAISDQIGYLSNIRFILLKEGKAVKLKNLSLKDLKETAKRYVNFPKFLIVSGFLEKGSGQAPVLLINALFKSTSSTGYFSFAQRIIVAPADLLSRAVSDVFRQKASSEFISNGNCKNAFTSTFRKLLIISIVPFSLAYFSVVEVFQFIFGQEWSVAGRYAQIMMPMFFLQFIVSPLSIVFVIAEKQKYDLILQAFLFAAVVLTFFIGYYKFDSIEKSILLFTIVYCVKYIFEFILAFRFSLGKT